MNRYTLTKEVKQKYVLAVVDYIEKLQASDNHVEGELELNLSDTELNPFTLGKLLEGLGYTEHNVDSNGWQMDFWVTWKKEGFKSLEVSGTGITFELILKEHLL